MIKLDVGEILKSKLLEIEWLSIGAFYKALHTWFHEFSENYIFKTWYLLQHLAIFLLMATINMKFGVGKEINPNFSVCDFSGSMHSNVSCISCILLHKYV